MGKTDDALCDLCVKLHEELVAKKHKWGFHLSYSVKDSWSKDSEFLVLTLNPQAKDSSGKPKKVVPREPWPKNNDFFDPKNNFPIKTTVQGILWELALASGSASTVKGGKAENSARNFCESKVILSSYVPFRTEGESDIDDWMLDFSNELWKRVFRIWMPRVIITFGNTPFAGMDALLGKISNLVTNESSPVSKYDDAGVKSTLKYNCNVYKNGLRLIGLPHPNARGHKGFPVKFPDNAEDNTPVRVFLREALAPIYGKTLAASARIKENADKTGKNPQKTTVTKRAGAKVSWDWRHDFSLNYDFIGRFQKSGFFTACRQGRWGFYALGVAPHTTFDDAGDFTENLGPVKIGKLWGYVDKNFQLSIKPQFSLAYKFSHGLAGVMTKKILGIFGQEKFGYIDLSGRWVIQPEYDAGFHYGDNGLASVGKNGSVGFIDKKGNVAIPFKFEMAFNFQSGIAAAQSGGKWGFINEDGEWVIKPRFDDVEQFYDIDHCKVNENGRWGLLGCNGEWLIKPKFDDISSSMRDGIATAKKDSLWGIIDEKGNWIVAPYFDDAFVPSNKNFIPVKKQGYWRVIYIH